MIACLRRAGVEVVERNRSVWGDRHNWSLGARQAARVAVAEARLARRVEDDADVLIVGYPGHFDLIAARRVARGRPIVFNPLVSLHDTLVVDRSRFADGSLAGRLSRGVDRAAFRRADLVVADTAAQARFFTERFGLDASHVAVAFVGAEDRLFAPAWQPPSVFRALFVGKLIPLHGLETILAAAALAPEIRFRVVGDGQLRTSLAARPANVEWVEWVEYPALPAEYQAAGCALGVFGASEKAARVIPNKAFQALASGTPLVTLDSPAARELLTHDVDAVLVPPGDAAALAGAVRQLATNRELAVRLGAAGRATYESRASEVVLGVVWRDLLLRATPSA